MRLVRLSIRNFRGWREGIVPLDRPLTILVGENRRGKSSTVNAIEWCLFGREIERHGRFWFSTTELKGRSYFRICPVNFRTRREHIDELFETLRRECARAASRRIERGLP